VIASQHISDAYHAYAVAAAAPLVVVPSPDALPIAHQTQKRRRRCQLPSALIVVLSSCWPYLLSLFATIRM